MALANFQLALAHLTASPRLCRQVRESPEMLRERYDLTDKEWRRLSFIAASDGMQANCMLYRANRLAPVALNLPDLCEELRHDLNRLISAYWEHEPTTDVNFLVEADRFCRFLHRQHGLNERTREVLQREHAVVRSKLAASRYIARHMSRDEQFVKGEPRCVYSGEYAMAKDQHNDHKRRPR